MKTKLVILLGLLLLFSPRLQSQNSKNKAHKVWISNVNNSKIIKGTLYEVNDESLLIMDKHSKEITIDASKINIIKIRRKGKIGKGILIGSLTGLATGAIIGIVSGDDPDKTVVAGWPIGTYTVEGQKKGEKALIYGVLLGLAGGGAGALIASKREKIIINGSIESYKSQIEFIRNF